MTQRRHFIGGKFLGKNWIINDEYICNEYRNGITTLWQNTSSNSYLRKIIDSLNYHDSCRSRSNDKREKERMKCFIMILKMGDLVLSFSLVLLVGLSSLDQKILS